MSADSRRNGPALVLLLALAATGAAAQPAASQPAASQPAASTSPGSRPPAAPPPAAQAPAAALEMEVSEADRVWQKDERGEFFIDKTPKIEGTYRWIDRDRMEVKIGHIMPIVVERFDDKYFYFKVYKPVPPELPAGPSAEEIARVAASYPGMPPAVDRLELRPFSQGMPTSGQWRNGFAVADINRDGHLDVIHGPARKSPGWPVILLGDSAGSWRLWQEATFHGQDFDYGDVVVADFDGDGHLDLAMAVHLRGLLVMRHDGRGAFTPWGKGLPWAPVKGRSTRPFTSRALAVADWNEDGRPDLIALSEGPSSTTDLAEQVHPIEGKAIFLNQGDGSWSILTGPPGDTSLGDHVRVADLDGNGQVDFVTDMRSIGNRRVLNVRTPDGRWELRELPDLRPRAAIWAIESDDLNGDRHPDLIVSYSNRELDTNRAGVDLYYGAAAGNHWRRVPLLSTAEQLNFRALATGDLDGDRRRDVIALDSQGNTHVFLREPDGSYVTETSPELAPGKSHLHCVGYRSRLVDLDRDGRDELIATFAGEQGSERLYGIDAYCPEEGAMRAHQAALRPAAGASGQR